jgi:hypothetical protein
MAKNGDNLMSTSVHDSDCDLFYDTQYLDYMVLNDRITDELERSFKEGIMA